MQNSIHFLDKLKRGGIPLGTIVSFNDPTVTEAVCRDLDFVWIDSEHSAMSLPVVQGHVMATKGSRAAAIVRVPWNDPVLIKPVLDMGADGIVTMYSTWAAMARAARRIMGAREAPSSSRR